MGPACSKPPGDIATAAGVAQLPKIHGGAVLDAWCGGDNSVVTAGADGRVVPTMRRRGPRKCSACTRRR